ncbi:pilus assembly protein CpaB [Breoghania corrubedonensis]|uniref:Pilus assembly protein CpaB n=1 Tax=Breoghania corrubedonensis TaxID=665038 RepID=A0A2T5VG50_9HYPH|nr:Flp pilus assembly protein CpaB [Breoghania corrubedonensis]PTW62708.1 pilus assembly protein CpaB [Breoghania corrubedonensis]
MKLARIAVLGVALGAGLIAARLMMNMSAPAPEPVETVQLKSVIDTTDVLIASSDIPLGSMLKAGDMSWEPWPKGSVADGFITRQNRPDALTDMAGRIAKAPVFSGEPIREQRLIKTDRGFMSSILPKGKRAVAVSVEAVTTAGGFILPGDHVDVILTKSGRRGSSGAVSRTILQNVRVLAIDTKTKSENDEKSLPPNRTATLELDPTQAEIITESQQLGTIALTLRSAEDSIAGDDEAVTTSDGGVNFVRFGVTTQESTRE